ncbi:MAG: ArsS family sensor histidine kinase [Campylobacterota bacterium]
MNKSSIFFTITFSFLISIALVIVSFFILITHNYNKSENELLNRYVPIIKRVMKNYQRNHDIQKELVENLNQFNYEIYLEKSKINAVTYNPKTKILVERKSIKRSKLFRVLRLKDNNYIYMIDKGNTILIKDNNSISHNGNLYIFLVFSIVIITIVLMYLITLRKLMPLKLLKDKVKTLGDENFDFECCNLDGKDEVSLLAIEFKNSAQKLKDVKEARNVFIRNIMHELKTPITKGKFLTELDRSEENNEKLKKVFIRLESLINEFASIEELIASTKNIEQKVYFLDDIVDNAKDALMLDDESIVTNYDNIKIKVNFKLFSIAVKNLIDNAIKYSDDATVTIKLENENIVFENRGKGLEESLDNYFEPFWSGSRQKDNSFGLGLYIVYNILKANNYILDYEYSNNINRFICKKDKSSTT